MTGVLCGVPAHPLLPCLFCLSCVRDLLSTSTQHSVKLHIAVPIEKDEVFGYHQTKATP